MSTLVDADVLQGRVVDAKALRGLGCKLTLQRFGAAICLRNLSRVRGRIHVCRIASAFVPFASSQRLGRRVENEDGCVLSHVAQREQRSLLLNGPCRGDGCSSRSFEDTTRFQREFVGSFREVFWREPRTPLIDRRRVVFEFGKLFA